MLLAIYSRGVDNAFAATRGAISPDIAKKEWAEARKLGLPITMHTSGVGGIKVLNEAGLLGPDVQLVHPLNTTAEERAALAQEQASSYSISPVGEARPAGDIQFVEMLEAGVKMSLSVDHITTYDCRPVRVHALPGDRRAAPARHEIQVDHRSRWSRWRRSAVRATSVLATRSAR